MQPLSQLFPTLSGPRDIVVTMHQKPDPDAMGSSLALARVLGRLGNRVTVVSPTNWADFLSWMPGCDEVIDFEQRREAAEQAISRAEWVFCLDFNALHRTKRMEDTLRRCSAKRIMIDHHEEPQTDMFDYGISVIPKSSTSELVYEMILESGHRSLIDDGTAACLYAGVMADTGSFRFPITTASVHRMVADLMSEGFDHARVHQQVYDSYLENRLRFLGHILSNRMEILYEYDAALIHVTRGDLLKYDIRTGDTEGIVNYPLSIRGIRFAALLIDRDEERRWSFRSKDEFDCNGFARMHFEGGGHHNAAGGRSPLSLDENIRKFKTVLPAFIQTHHNKPPIQ
jgi:phosphoesterase RecJ-like protein